MNPNLKIIVDILPLIFLSIAFFYSLKMPFQKSYVFENTAKLWLIYIILVTSGIFFAIATVKLMDYTYLRQQFMIWNSIYGLSGGLIFVIPWFLPSFVALTSSIAALPLYFFSTNIIKKLEKLIPVEENTKIPSLYKEPIALFENTLIRVVNAVKLPIKPKVYIKTILQPNCFVFGKDSRNLSITVTIGLLESIKEGNITAKEVEAIISHEIGHVLNADLRLVSTLKIFSDLKITKLVILGFFATTFLLFLIIIGINLLYYYPDLNIIEKSIKGFDLLKVRYPLIFYFIILYIAYMAVELLIRATFKSREFYADAQAIQIFKNKNIYVRTLTKISYPFSLLTADSRSLAIIPYTVIILWPLRAMEFLFKFFYFLPKGFQKKVTKKIEDKTKKVETVYSTHPTLKQRIEAIDNRIYFPVWPIHISYKSYLTVGTTIFISFMFFIFIVCTLDLYYSPVSLFFSVWCALPALVIINNAHMKIIHKYDLKALASSFILGGFAEKNAIARDYGRKLFLANHIGHLPFIIYPTFMFIVGIPLKISVVMLVMQFLIVHVSTIGFLHLIYWLKKA